MQSFVHDLHTTISNERSSNYEGNENLKEMFPQYYMHRDMFSMFKS